VKTAVNRLALLFKTLKVSLTKPLFLIFLILPEFHSLFLAIKSTLGDLKGSYQLGGRAIG